MRLECLDHEWSLGVMETRPECLKSMCFLGNANNASVVLMLDGSIEARLFKCQRT